MCGGIRPGSPCEASGCPRIRRAMRPGCTTCCMSSITRVGRGSQWRRRRGLRSGRPSTTGCAGRRVRIPTVLQPIKSGAALIEEINRTITPTPTLWWLGHGGFVVRFATITFYIDPCFSTTRARRIAPPLTGAEVCHADMIFSTHAHSEHLDAPTLLAMLAASKRAKLVLPKSATELAHTAGIPYDRMTTTDADLRIECFKDSLYERVYAIPSAHPQLDRTADGGYPYLGYLIRFGRWTIYHAGACVLYAGLVE